MPTEFEFPSIQDDPRLAVLAQQLRGVFESYNMPQNSIAYIANGLQLFYNCGMLAGIRLGMSGNFCDSPENQLDNSSQSGVN